MQNRRFNDGYQRRGRQRNHQVYSNFRGNEPPTIGRRSNVWRPRNTQLASSTPHASQNTRRRAGRIMMVAPVNIQHAMSATLGCLGMDFANASPFLLSKESCDIQVTSSGFPPQDFLLPGFGVPQSQVAERTTLTALVRQGTLKTSQGYLK